MPMQEGSLQAVAQSAQVYRDRGWVAVRVSRMDREELSSGLRGVDYRPMGVPAECRPLPGEWACRPGCVRIG